MKQAFAYRLILLFLGFTVVNAYAQQEEKKPIGGEEYIVVKPYKPVLSESYKLSETPEGDTSSSTPPVMDYSLRARKAQTEYETSVIKAVKIKDEQLTKLYRNYLRLGLGNYTTYVGDLYVNALRSKKGALGFRLNHHSGNPGLKDVGNAGFSKNHAGVYGKYFLSKSTFSGQVDYDRDVVHYYGYDANSVILSKSDIKQRFNKFGMHLNLASNNISKDKLDYAAGFGFSTLADLYEVDESDFIVSGTAAKKISDYYVKVDASFNYFKKTRARGESLMLLNDLSRSIVNFTPTLNFKQDKIDLVLGLNLGIEKNLDTDVRLFPRIDLQLPIAEQVLYVFAGVNGGIVKNTYRTIVEENPFVKAEITPFNTVEKISLKAGLKGNFSKTFSFVAMVKYTTVDDMLLFYSDADSVNFNKFNIIFIDGKVLNLHGEVTYKSGERFEATLRFDQFNYSMEGSEKAWHKPNTEAAINLKYNLIDKIIVTSEIYARGSYPVRIQDTLGFTSVKVKGYMDANLGVEYRYSKLLSVFVNFNNLGFSRYYRWYNYPSERLNVLGGITFSF